MASYHLLVCLCLTSLLTPYFPTSYAQSENTAQPEVTILQGTLLGTTLETRNGRNISGFLGVPYAQPPIGNLRFANPVAADVWNGTLNATVDPSMCPQISSDLVVGEEDCLYLNVYTPELPSTTNSPLLPVMVYIHGGAFKYGSQTSTTVGPEYLLDENVVFVAMNYRLGLLGFLSTGDEVASGNWALKDQVLALKWVQDNIRYFGGDPDQVTLFGESAGAASVHLLTLSNATIGLFHRYILQSGSALAKWAHRPRAAYSTLAYELGEFVGCLNDTSDSLISCLRTVDVPNMIATASQFVVSSQSSSDVTWGPTDEPDIEGAILLDSPSNLFGAGEIRDIPSMSGVVRDEGLILTTGLYRDEEMLYDLLENFDTVLPNLLFWMYETESWVTRIDAIKAYWFNNDLTSNTSVLLSNLTALAGDSYFYYPAHNALEQQHALSTSPQYFYTLNYRGTFSQTDLSNTALVNYGVSHADDLLYIFPSEALFTHLNRTMSEADHVMVDIMVQLWTSFAINGTPTASNRDDTVWDPYSMQDNYLRIGNNSETALEVQYSFFQERMQFWENLYAISDTDTETATETEPEPEASVSQDSGTETLSSNLLFVLLVACSKFVL